MLEGWSNNDKIAAGALGVSLVSLLISIVAAVAAIRQAGIAARIEAKSREQEEPLADMLISEIEPWPGWYEVHVRINNRSPFLLEVDTIEVVRPNAATITDNEGRTSYTLPSEAPSPPTTRKIKGIVSILAGGTSMPSFWFYTPDQSLRQVVLRITFTNANRRKPGYVIDTEGSI